MHQSLRRIFIVFFLLSGVMLPAHALFVNNQNQIFAQPGEKVTITYVSVASTHCGEFCNIFTPTTQAMIDTKTTTVGKTIDLGVFNNNTELILQLMDPATGFTVFNDTRNNIDLENHIQFTNLGNGKYLAGWQISHGNGNDKYDDLVIMVQSTPVTHANSPQKAAATSWNLYE